MRMIRFFSILAASACLISSSPVMAQREGDSYILSDDGVIELFALPGCVMHGKQGLYGLAQWKLKESQIICWQYDKVIYIYAPDRNMIFDPSEVRTRGANEDQYQVFG